MSIARDQNRPDRLDQFMLEGLEARVLLSDSNPFFQDAGLAQLVWHGQQFEVVQDSWVLTFTDALGSDGARQAAGDVLARLGVPGGQIQPIGRGRYASFTTTGRVSEQAASRILHDVPNLIGFEPNRISRTSLLPNDPLFTNQWQLANTGQFVPGSGQGTIGADVNTIAAWDATFGTQDVIVAVIDTGVDLDHPDLASNIWSNPGEIPGNGVDDDGNGFIDDINGWDFGELDNDPSDAVGHGTAVAGTIGAVGNNGLGVTGVAWSVSLLPMKIADQFGALSLSAIVGSHDYLTMMRERGVNIVASNNSYGAFAPAFFEDQIDGFIAEKQAIQRFIASGGIFVAAAGNNGADNDSTFTSFPASYNLPGIISVAATDNNDALAAFSNFGAKTVDLGAPGVNVFTTFNGGGFGSISGTSFSSPMTAGAVALLKSAAPETSPEEIRQVLIDSSDPQPSLQNKTVSGGRLNIAEALRIIRLDGPVVTSIDPGPVVSSFSTITVSFNKDLDASAIGVSFVSLVRAGGDGDFTTSTGVGVGDVTLSSPRTVTITPATTTLPPDAYRLTLSAPGFVDLSGNLLNGDTLGGADEVYDFSVVGLGGSFEANDTLATATPAPFAGSGSASFDGQVIGDGIQANLDVDLYRITIPRGGLITARVDAAALSTPSTLDGFLRLFDALGNQLVANDQFHGPDPFLDFFVSTGGAYFVGVSGFGNAGYDPSLAGSGASQSTGSYNLSIDVALVQDDQQRFDADLPIPIPIPDQGTISSTITITDTRNVRDVNLDLTIQHDFVGDLRISLFSPSGTQVILFDRRGAEGDNLITTTFDDEAPGPISAGVAPFTGSFRPEQALGAFDGLSAAGDWTLVVQDAAQVNGGTLVDWSIQLTLSNDIFGAFELNDTITRARTLDEITGTGLATRDAFVGDGGFGILDVDLFRFVADLGATLSTTVTAQGGLDTALRLFDENGAQIVLSNPPATPDASIDGFVFAQGGTFYLGVSADANTAYDATLAASGAPAPATGDYTLQVSLTPGASDGAQVLGANDVRLGVGTDAAFGATDTAGAFAGLRFNGVDFLIDQAASTPIPDAFFGASVDRSSFRNGSGPTAVPFSLTSTSDAFNRRLTAEGLFKGLGVRRSFAYGLDDRFIAVDVVLTNTTASALSSIAWMEAFNPQQGLNLDFNPGPNTINDVLTVSDVFAGEPGDSTLLPYAQARFTTNTFRDGMTVALAAPRTDTRATASIFTPVTQIRDPFQILAAPSDPDGLDADQTMALAFNVGDLPAGTSTTLRYFILFGTSPDNAQQLYRDLSDGSGTGHLALDPANPATETLQDGATTPVPTLPYRLYHPEGFANFRASTFVPLLNPNADAARVVVIAHYARAQSGPRDQLLLDTVIPAHTRRGLTITNPTLFAAGTQLVRPDEPYSLEIRSELPIAATLSRFDFNIATGESFTSQTSTIWTFGEGFKGVGVFDFPVYLNTTGSTIKVTTTLIPAFGPGPIQLTQILAPYRRGGLNLAATGTIPDGPFGIQIQADAPIVATLTHFDTNLGGGFGVIGNPTIGNVTGVTPEGQFGINGDAEFVTALNVTTQDALVLFTFLFENGSAFRQTLSVPAQRRRGLIVAELPGFPVGQPYSVIYESTNNVPVSVTLPTFAFGEAEGTTFTNQARSLWAFADGFRPAGENPTQVDERLRVFNPSQAQALVEITLNFSDGTTASFRQSIEARRSVELDVHDFVLGARRLTNAFYGLTVKSTTPIVSSLSRRDDFFPGAFATLGTPLGVEQVID